MVLCGVHWTTKIMPKPERKAAILTILNNSNLALPPKVVYVNLAREGATFSRRTTFRLLQEMAEEGLVRKLESTSGYYEITQDGMDFLAERDET